MKIKKLTKTYLFEKTNTPAMTSLSWMLLHQEYKSREFNQYCKSNGILQQFTVPHTPQQNGVAERKNRTLVECARSMLQGKNISNGFWAEAINTTVYLKNRSPTKSLELKTPFEAFYGYKPKVSH